jgi:hypothetical protein
VSIPLVFDTNILISGYLWSGKCRQAIKQIKSGNYALLYSRETLDEFARVLSLKFHLEPSETYRMAVNIDKDKGHLEFILNGNKLKGAFVLTKLKQKGKDWLLIKKKDQFA